MDFVFDSYVNGTKLKILSVLDKFTRQCLALEVQTHFTSRDLQTVLTHLFEKHGAPTFLRSDNGSEFISKSLAVLFSQSGCESKFIKPGSPWMNGFVESFHSTLRRHHLDVEALTNLADSQVKTRIYQRYYNEQRPHSSLGGLSL